MPSTFPDVSSYEYSCNDKSKRFPLHNPATGELITTIQAGDVSTTQKAISKAQKAFEAWGSTTLAERSQILLQCADALEERKEELAELLTLENGKPKQDALAFDINHLINVFRFFSALIDKLPTQFYDRGSVYVAVVREPHGVCAGILPWNWPPIHTGGKVAPALACGNTFILKPAEQAPLTVMRMVEILQTVLPDGVLQVVPGLGVEVPQALLESDVVKMVSFTGSTVGGMAAAKTAAKTIKPMALELGGKNALLVFEDADLERAARDAVEGAFFNKGEACTASSRLLIQDSIYDKFVSTLAKAIKKLKVGDGTDPESHVGPLISAKQRERVLNYIKIGKEQGATILAEGELPSDPKLKNGYWVKPTLFTEVTRDMTIAQEEIFGPVVTATRFKDEDEALSIANESAYGLVALVYTQDMEKGMRVARRLQSGMVWFNNYRRNILGIPFGGVKHSGHGREHAIDTLNEWTTEKFIQWPSGRGQLGQWRAIDKVFGGNSKDGMSPEPSQRPSKL